MPYIVVDAGHGGWDRGAHFSGYNEKDITLCSKYRVAQSFGLGDTIHTEA